MRVFTFAVCKAYSAVTCGHRRLLGLSCPIGTDQVGASAPPGIHLNAASAMPPIEKAPVNDVADRAVAETCLWLKLNRGIPFDQAIAEPGSPYGRTPTRPSPKRRVCFTRAQADLDRCGAPAMDIGHRPADAPEPCLVSLPPASSMSLRRQSSVCAGERRVRFYNGR
jgi:hypothetical protein